MSEVQASMGKYMYLNLICLNDFKSNVIGLCGALILYSPPV